jgi:colanic acid/amylovoran biosynthesis glycosyltransferase
MNIAVFSPSQNPYSETFIQAHKNGLKGNVFYYYGSGNNIKLEDHKQLMSLWANRLLRLYTKLKRKPDGYIQQQRILHSLKANKIEAILVEYGTHAHHLRNTLKTSKIPVIVHFHGYDASMDAVIKSCNSYKEVFEYSKFVIAVSMSMQKKLMSLGCAKEKVIYNPNGPDSSFLEIEPRFSKKTFIGLGRFVDKKAPYYVVLAFKKVLDTFPDAQLVIGGKITYYCLVF